MPDDDDLPPLPDDFPPEGEMDSLPDLLGSDQTDLPPGRREPTLTERLKSNLSRPRRDRLRDRLEPVDTIAWSPAEDSKLHRFITLREAGFAHDVDICRDYETWKQVSFRVEIGVFGYHVWTTGEFGDPHSEYDHDHPELISLNRESDWELLKEMVEWDLDPESEQMANAEAVLRSLEVI